MIDNNYVPPATFPSDIPFPNTTKGHEYMKNLKETMTSSGSHAQRWNELLNKPKLGAHDKMFWLAHFTTLQDASRSPPAISGLTPLFRDNAHSLALVKHGMDVIATTTEHLNHGKVPVLNVD